MRHFIAGIISGFLVATVISVSAIGLRVETGGAQQCISAAQAACFADCAIAIDNTTEDALCGGIARSDMRSVRAHRSDSCQTGFAATCRGQAVRQHDSFPDAGSWHVLGIVPDGGQ